MIIYMGQGGRIVISDLEKNFLLKTARASIAEKLKVDFPYPEKIESDLINQKRGTFVTLTLYDSLRGCIGQIVPEQSILETIKDNAFSAAYRDPRFPPVDRSEYKDLHIEISILTKPEKLEYNGLNDLITKLEVGKHGVILSKGNASATFLPQVWEDLSDKELFLSYLCQKAGLHKDEWKKGALDIQTYEVEAFEDQT
jgi:AmmeMemoRadiSam system protein A